MPRNSSLAEIFCSYAHEDENWLRTLKNHLSILQRQERISLWYDRQIQPGMNWQQEVDIHLKNASIILLLVSVDFLASDYCYGIEMQRALERHNAGEARVIPILLRPVDNWRAAPFAHLAVLPTDARPIVGRRDRDQAFADVTAGIRHALDDLSSHPASLLYTGLPAIWNIPYPPNPFFIGRQDLLTLIHQRFQNGQVTALSQSQAISGLGGIGKTQVAVEYAYRFCQDYQAVLWVNADTREELISSYVTLAALLGLPEKEARDQQLAVQAVIRWLQTQDRWLLILDNADELHLIPQFLPLAFAGHLLITTRAAALGRLAQRLEVTTFSAEEGALFLLRRAGLLAPNAPLEQGSAADCEYALRITQDLGGLPLALDQAGAYIEETGLGLASYQELYQNLQTRLLTDRRGMVSDHPEPVTTTWELSFNRVQRRNAAAADLLSFCSFLAPDNIPEALFVKGAHYLGPRLEKLTSDPRVLAQAMETARAYSLLSRDPTNQFFQMHRLVQAVLRERMPGKKRTQWMLRAIQAVNAAFPEVTFAQWPQCEKCVPHALTCVRWIIKQGDEGMLEAANLLNLVGFYLTERGRYEEALSSLQNALTTREQKLGPEHPDTATSLHNLAWLYGKQGHYAEAEPLSQRALVIREKQLGPEHPDVAASLHNLAVLYEKQGRYVEAEPLARRALAICEKQLGTEHRDTATILHDLAWLYERQGRYVEAEPLARRALAICEKQLGAEHPDTATSLNRLAVLYERQGHYAEAERLSQRVVLIREKQLGREHPDTIISINRLVVLYERQGRYTEAEPLALQALSIREKQLGPEHPDTATSLHNLAVLYEKQGRYDEAEALYQRSLTIYEKQLGAEYRDAARSLNNLALLYEKQERYDEAEAAFQRALSIREKQLGPEHPGTATSLNDLAVLYSNQGRYAEAEPLLLKALAIREKLLTPEHPRVATTLHELALLYERQGRYAEAEPLAWRALTICEKQWGPKHAETATCLNRMASVYERQGRYTEAELLAERALAIREKQLGAEHPDTATCLHNLAWLYERQGRYSEAEPLFQQALAIREKQLGPEHPDTASTLHNLAVLSEKRQQS